MTSIHRRPDAPEDRRIHSMDPMPIALDALASRARALYRALIRIGWELLDLDIHLDSGRARIEVRRRDGLTALLTVDAIGRAHIERSSTRMEWRRERGLQMERPVTQFLGRTRYEGPRQALRALAEYLAENAPTPIEAGAVRQMLRLVADGAHHQVGGARPKEGGQAS
jgi:hypothetical protein